MATGPCRGCYENCVQTVQYGYTSTQQTTQRALLNERSVLVYVLGPTRAHRASTGQRFRAIFLHRHASGGREGEVAGGEGGETRAAPAALTVEGGGDVGRNAYTTAETATVSAHKTPK